MPVTTQNRTTASGQDGFFAVAAGIWEDTAINLSVGPDFNIGLIFDWDLQTNGVGTALDAPRLMAPMSLAVVVSSATLVGAQTFELLAVPEAAPADFSDTVTPTNRNELLVSSLTATWAGAALTLTFPFGNTADALTNLETLRMLHWGSARWSGRVALSLRMPSAGALWLIDSVEAGATPPTLTTTEVGAWNGLIGGPTGPRQRFVRDGRFGMPALNTALVRDGDNHGLWVRANDWDPEDPEATYQRRPGEGTVDDGTPEL